MKKTKRITSKVMALMGAILLLFTIVALPVSAAETTNGTDATFHKYLVMKDEANVPNVTFEYTIEAISGNSEILIAETRDASGAILTPRVYTTSQLEGVPTITPSVSFTPDDATYAAAQTGDTVVLDSGEKYAKKELTLDFSDVTYTKPGIYRYKLTEVNTVNDGVVNDEELVRYCDVYVGQKAGSSTQDLEVQGYCIHKSADTIPSKDAVDWNAYGDLKDNGYQNEYETYNLKIQKEITGNHGWKNKEFEFTLKIDGILPYSRYTVVLDNASSESNTSDECVKSIVDGENTVYYLEADENGDLEYTFYLANKGGNKEYIEVLGLTAATTYYIEEDAEDYNPSWEITLADGTLKGEGDLADCLDDEYAMGEDDNIVIFTNNREVNVMTGLNMDRLPIVIIIAVIAVALIVFVSVQRKKAKKDDEE